jgi:cytochrome P450 family 6
MTLDASRGEIWRSLRKILSPTFTSGKLKSMLEPIDEVADNLVKHLEKLANDKNVNVKPIYQTFTLETIGESYGLFFKPCAPL